METEGSKNTNFGFRLVSKPEHKELVNDVFSSVAGRYDLMNDLMSAGLHRIWKNTLISFLNPPKGSREYKLLDVAGGTGDVAIRFAQRSGVNTTVTVCDPSPEMLKICNRRITKSGFRNRINTIEANGEALPLADDLFDWYTIAFGIRNVTHIDLALSEAYRVLKPGGRFLCLEFSQVNVPLFDRLYDYYSFEIIPLLGRLTIDQEEPYRYLVESIRKFPSQEDFAHMIKNASFSHVSHQSLSCGIASIHSGWKI